MTNTDELIVYTNSRNGLGVRILGAKRATNKSGIYIKEILDDGLAQKDGRLKVGDQIVSINDESCIGISREHAVNILRSAAATNQVRLRIKHFIPPLSSPEYQKLLYDEKSTDDDEDIHRHNNRNITNNDISNEIPIKKSSRRHRHTTHNLSNTQQIEHNQSIKGLDVSDDALQALLNSRFKLSDLVDLLKKTYPNLFSNDPQRELEYMEQLSQTNSEGRITLKDFERQSSVLLGERINLLIPFHSSSSNNSTETEVHREIISYRAKIDELQTKVITCERSQRLATEVELEYEDLLKYLYEQLRQYKINEINQIKQLRANDQFIQKLFHYLSRYAQQPNDEHLLTQLKYEYEQQQRVFSNNNQMSINKDQYQF